MAEALFDPVLLRSFGDSPEDVSRHLQAELDALEGHLGTRQGDWTRVQAGREWSPAQELEHVLAIGRAGGKAIHLLLSEKELRAFPQLQGELKEGKRQTPDFARPSPDGLAWEAWTEAWQTHRQELEGAAARLRATPERRLWHPYFGELDALDWMRSLVGHLRGHRELLERSVTP
ncbi:DinB family protein [Deinococcus cavernae]|uniref:DinB family protein n=1 Tax=Deinococcus cavernae TaxID=2320857 RepID=A0A418VAN4_9DEIO|nr:DinB family protein [Deinococcus cavernae]RJF73119.1 DinB family protein [Deinococcus cavernae]